ncbi:MAG: hypothetical protein QXI51_07540 [Candidatus Korarchaeum sp.]
MWDGKCPERSDLQMQMRVEDRQLNAAVNLYLQMEGLSPSPKLFEELMAWSGFALTGEEASGLEAGESQGLNGYLFILSSEP